MKIAEKRYVNLPDWAVCPLYYGDYTSESINEEDIQILDSWADEMVKDGFNPSEFELLDEEPSFMTNPEFGLPCACYRAVFFKWAHE